MYTRNDMRQDILKSIIKNIFFTLTNTAKIDNDNYGVVIRGKGKELKDCTFTPNYRNDYVNLFKITFAFDEKKCRFDYMGKQKTQEEFNREIAVSNAIRYFSIKHEIDICHSFYSNSERYLFSKLIYSFLERLLDVLFADYSEYKQSEINRVVKMRFNKAISEIRALINNNSIHSLIYSIAKAKDVELLIDPRYNVSECDHAFLIKVGNNAVQHIGIKVVNCDIKLKVKNNVDSQGGISSSSHKVYTEGVRFPFNEIDDFHYHDSGKIESIEVWGLKDINHYFPQYCYFASCLPELKREIQFSENENDSEKTFSEYQLNRLFSEIYGRAFNIISSKYAFDKKRVYLNWISNMNTLLEEISTENYDRIFSVKKDLKEINYRGYSEFVDFLKRNNIEIYAPVVVFIYLVSTLIDELCYSLENFNFDDMRKYIHQDEEEYTGHISKVKDYIDSVNIDRTIAKYDEFYKSNIKSIEKFIDKVEILNERSFLSLCDMGNVYNPYRYLKLALLKYYDGLNDVPDETVFFDLLNRSTTSKPIDTGINEGFSFENGKKYRFEFEAYGDTSNPFSCIIIRRESDGSLKTVFEKDDLLLKEQLQKYSFEFIYTDDTTDNYFLAFGYGNSMNGYSVRRVKIYEIE